MYLTLKRSVAPRRGLRWWAVLPILLVAWARLQAATQTLSWISPAEDRPLIWGRAYPLMAQTSSGLPVTFRVLSSPAFIVDGAVTATNAGTITQVAEQAGSLQFDPVSLTRSLNQTTLSSMRRGGYETSGSACAVQVVGKLTYVAADTAGLQLIEVSDPAKAREDRRLRQPRVGAGVRLDGGRAYVADALSAVFRRDAAFPIDIKTDPTRISSLWRDLSNRLRSLIDARGKSPSFFPMVTGL